MDSFATFGKMVVKKEKDKMEKLGCIVIAWDMHIANAHQEMQWLLSLKQDNYKLHNKPYKIELRGPCADHLSVEWYYHLQGSFPSILGICTLFARMTDMSC